MREKERERDDIEKMREKKHAPDLSFFEQM